MYITNVLPGFASFNGLQSDETCCCRILFFVFESREVENLKAEIEQLQSLLVQRSEENEELADDITKMDKSIQEATAMRNEEKASNLKSLKEATEGKEALSAAMDVLQSFYQSLALVQQSAVKQRLRQEGREIKPEFSAGGYSGQSGQNSIIALLQKVAADFAKEASGLKAAEDAAASEFKQFLSNTKSDRKKKEITQQHNTMSMTSETASLEQRKKDLASTEKQLDAALEYYEAGTDESYLVVACSFACGDRSKGPCKEF